MQSSISSGGHTHVNYGHYHFPRIVQVFCPNCSTIANLVHSGGDDKRPYFFDTEHSSRIWLFFCPRCLKQDEVLWDETKKYLLANQIQIRTETVFAWNTDHLDYIISLLAGREKKKHAWAIFRNYIHGTWLSKINKPADIRKLIGLFKNNSGRDYSFD